MIALIINKVGRFSIIGKCEKCLDKHLNQYIYTGSFLVVTFLVCGFGGILCMITDIPIVQVYAFTTLVSCGLGMNVVNSVAVELFPTSLRYEQLLMFYL